MALTTAGGNNTVIGTGAGNSLNGSGNVFIGFNAGSDATFNALSNTLVIQNSNSSIPLIHGDFSANLVGIGKLATTYALEVEGTSEATQYKISALNTAPASATAPGEVGEIRITATYIYICIAPNVWVRAALTTW